ncbi:MAG TPA: DUF2809 domain-containing protein [Flavisolibacter sp.]|jgi:hypothetical protein
MFRFQKIYFLLFLLLLWFEVLIALFVHDQFVRPYLGDFLVVLLLYCFTRSFLQVRVITAIMMVLLFSYAVETAQYFTVINHLGLEENVFAKTVIGSSFDWQDILAYTLGSLLIYLVEQVRMEKLFVLKRLPRTK